MTTPTTPATDVKRYTLSEYDSDYSTYLIIRDDDGLSGDDEIVSASAYDALAAELTRTQQELRKAEADRDALRTCYDGLLTKGNEVLAQRDAATAEVGRLRADAQRYRWLRAGGPGTGLYVADSGREWREVRDSDLDERIDAALAPSPTNSDGGGK